MDLSQRSVRSFPELDLLMNLIMQERSDSIFSTTPSVNLFLDWTGRVVLGLSRMSTTSFYWIGLMMQLNFPREVSDLVMKVSNFSLKILRRSCTMIALRFRGDSLMLNHFWSSMS